MSRKTIPTTLLAACCLLLAAPGQAQMDDEGMLFEEIPSVFGASKYEQKITEAPSSVSIVTADEIAKYGHRTLGDILASVPGFYTTYDRNYTYLGVRGFGIPGDYMTRILFLIDGHRLNDAVYSAGAVGRDFPLDVDLIDRVEIIRGPGSSLYGSNAFFGVVNVITRRGRDLQGLEVAGSYGNQNTRQGRLSYGDQFGNGMELLLSGTLYRTDGDDDLYFPEFDDPASDNGHVEDMDAAEVGSLFGELNWADFTLQGVYGRYDKEVPTAAWGTIFNNGEDRTTDNNSYVSLKYDHSFADLSQLTARVSYNRYWYDGHYIYDDEEGEGDEVVPVDWPDGAKGKWWGVDGQYTRRFFGAHRVSVGGEYRDEFQVNQYYYGDYEDARLTILDSSESSSVWAIYAQDEFTVAESLTLTAGVRHDRYSTFGGTTNPRLAAIYSPLRRTTLKALFGKAFRAPNAYEMFYTDDWVQFPNPDLDPETVSTYELVWEQGYGPHVSSKISGFYYKVEDLIDTVNYEFEDAPGEFWSKFENVGEVDTRGLELEVTGRWPNGLEGRCGYSYQRAEDVDSGEWRTNSPKHLAQFNVIAPLYTKVLFAGVEVKYTGKRRTPKRTLIEDATPEHQILDPFWVTNLTLLGRFQVGNWLDGLELSATAYNLFDKTYSDTDLGPTVHEQNGIEQDGRTLQVKAVARF